MSDDTGQPGEPAALGEPLRWPRDSKAEDFEVRGAGWTAGGAGGLRAP
jgi:hypothetical protein